MSRKKKIKKETHFEECEDCQDKLKTANLKIRILKRHLRSAERELAGIHKQINNGKLVPYDEQEIEVPETKEYIISVTCPNCGSPDFKVTEIKLIDVVKEFESCPDCGYQKMKKISTRSR